MHWPWSRKTPEAKKPLTGTTYEELTAQLEALPEMPAPDPTASPATPSFASTFWHWGLSPPSAPIPTPPAAPATSVPQTSIQPAVLPVDTPPTPAQPLETSMSIASQEIFDPMKQALGQDAVPLLEEFLAGVEAAADKLLAKGGSAAMAAAPAVNALFGLGSLLAINTLQAKLGTATTPAQLPANSTPSQG